VCTSLWRLVLLGFAYRDKRKLSGVSLAFFIAPLQQYGAERHYTNPKLSGTGQAALASALCSRAETES
jgi:hypothetical protein